MIFVRILVMCLVGVGLSEADQIRGRVVDAETGAPLEEVQIRSGELLSSSDADGTFFLQAVAGDTLHFARLGYRSMVQIMGSNDGVLLVELRAVALETGGVVVVGGLRAEELDEVAAAVSIVSAQAVERAGAQHLQDVLQAVPNLHWAGGTARPRYFQVRGIGERSQYAGEGAPNFSVGFVVDGIDMSGLGTGALFDIQQVEVFKGPQSSAFGANALAGLINVESADPSSKAQRSVRVGVGGNGMRRAEGVVNAPLSDNLALRAGYQWAQSDGFRRNVYLGMDDSNRRSESLLRLKMRYALDNGLLLRGTLFRVDAANGYDMWAPDNNRRLETYADRPGDDHQTTTALSVQIDKALSKHVDLLSISTYALTDLDYSYDGDWGNDAYWLGEPYRFDPQVEGWSYDFFDRTLRQRTSLSQEVRLTHREVLLGIYARTQREEDEAVGYLFGGSSSDLQARFDMANVALYGQFERTLSSSLRLTFNARVEHSGIDYSGRTNGGAERVRYDVGQWLPGGKVALNWQHRLGANSYVAIARGYRAGGINQHPYLAAQNRPYDPEYMLNIEAGYRLSAPRYRVELIAFHGLREGQQVSLSSQQTPGDPNSFYYFTANAASGRNSGVEAEGRVELRSNLHAFASMAYLNTRVDPYVFDAADGQRQQLGGRAAAHAPEWSVRLGSEYVGDGGLSMRVDWTLTDGFYFSDSHDQRADAYQLVNASMGYGVGRWQGSLWMRNLFDERYAVRGFYFGLAPPNYADTLYLSYGDPRQMGVSLTTHF